MRKGSSPARKSEDVGREGVGTPVRLARLSIFNEKGSEVLEQKRTCWRGKHHSNLHNKPNLASKQFLIFERVIDFKLTTIASNKFLFTAENY